MKLGDRVVLLRDHFPWRKGAEGTVVEVLAESRALEGMFAVQFAEDTAPLWLYGSKSLCEVTQPA